IFKNNPEMINALDRRHEVYNETLNYINSLEKMGKAIVIAPSIPILMSRFEKKRPILDIVYNLGRKDAATNIDLILELLGK
ncbi:MAG: DUF6363 domain-containing protein, partial [Oscillospiraceae bacterium]